MRSGKRIKDDGVGIDADGKLIAPCAEKPQEGPVSWLLGSTLPGQTEGKDRGRAQPGEAGEGLGTTCKGNKTALAAIPPCSVIAGADGLRAALLLCSLALFFPPQLDVCVCISVLV